MGDGLKDFCLVILSRPYHTMFSLTNLQVLGRFKQSVLAVRILGVIMLGTIDLLNVERRSCVALN